MTPPDTRRYSGYRPTPSYVPRRPAAAAEPAGLRIGAFVVLAMGIWRLVERWVLSFWFESDASAASMFGWASFFIVLGIAMLQGSETARKVALFVTGLALLVICGAGAAIYFVGFGHLWPLLATVGLSTLGIFVLVKSSSPSPALIGGSLFCIVLGWAGSIVATVMLVGTPGLAELNMMREWSSPDRAYVDAEAGLELKVPPRWVIFKQGSPLRNEEKALVSLAHTEIVAIAQLFRGTRTHASLDYFLDALIKEKETESDVSSLQPLERTEDKIGVTPARRLKVAWKRGRATDCAYYVAWQDGDEYYYLYLYGPRALTQRLEQELVALEKNVGFSAPIKTFLDQQAPQILASCPLLSEKSLLRVRHAVAKGAAPEGYCREGYRLALKGQPLIDLTSAEHMRALMQRLFATMPKASLGRLGAYVERLVANQAPSAAEDREMMETMRVAFPRLAQADQDGLRGFFAMAIEMGQFELGQRNRELQRPQR